MQKGREVAEWLDTDRCFYLTWHQVFVNTQRIQSKSIYVYQPEYEIDVQYARKKKTVTTTQCCYRSSDTIPL